jgi:uncharacterized C2H2 Zn-finger protein
MSKLPDIIDELKPSIFKLKSIRGVGTAFVIHAQGLLISNRHVIGPERFVVVANKEEKEFIGRVIFSDSVEDIALIYVPDLKLEPFPWGGNEEVREGVSVIAIGNPLDYDFTVTKGIISSKSREIDGLEYIQTDVPINPGNSGGPLVTMDGKVIGINTLKHSSAESIGFSLPIATVKEPMQFVLDLLPDIEGVYYCPNCGNLFKTKRKYCESCGSLTEDIEEPSIDDLKKKIDKYEKGEEDTEEEPVEEGEEYKFCPKCGRKRREGDIFCGGCGYKLEGGDNNVSD